MTIEQINDRIALARIEGVIYNAEYLDLKARLASLIEKAKNVANGVYLQGRPVAQREYSNANLDKMYWATLGAHSFVPFKKALAATSARSDAERTALNAFDNLYHTFADTAANLLALKPLIAKGRRPSAGQIERQENAKQCEKVVAVLVTALASFREVYRNSYISFYQNRLKSLERALQENGLDLNTVYPYPASNLPRKVYAQAKENYNWGRHVTQAHPDLKNDGRPNSPYYAQVKPDAFEAAKKEAIRAADASIDGYIRKLAGKIGPGDYNVQYTGNLWSGSDVVVRDGEQTVQLWHTKCILNVSCLGTIFNQWPTRRVS